MFDVCEREIRIELCLSMICKNEPKNLVLSRGRTLWSKEEKSRIKIKTDQFWNKGCGVKLHNRESQSRIRDIKNEGRSLKENLLYDLTFTFASTETCPSPPFRRSSTQNTMHENQEMQLSINRHLFFHSNHHSTQLLERTYKKKRHKNNHRWWRSPSSQLLLLWLLLTLPFFLLLFILDTQLSSGLKMWVSLFTFIEDQTFEYWRETLETFSLLFSNH